MGATRRPRAGGKDYSSLYVCIASLGLTRDLSADFSDHVLVNECGQGRSDKRDSRSARRSDASRRQRGRRLAPRLGLGVHSDWHRGTRTDARLTAHPGSGTQSLLARRTSTVTPAPTTSSHALPFPSGLRARCQRNSSASAPPTPPRIGCWCWLSHLRSTKVPGHCGSWACRAEGVQAIPTACPKCRRE